MKDQSEIFAWTQFLRLEDIVLLAQCEVDRFRASGPGGQKRNKTDSAVRLRHAPTSLAVEAVESRSQHENRARALRRLRLEIALNARAEIDEATALPEELAEALRAGKGRALSVGRRDVRYPAVIAALFDRIEAVGWQLSTAAEELGISISSLARFLESDPVVWRSAQERRQALGMTALRARG
jgi:AraC-like DNA-binding protein